MRHWKLVRQPKLTAELEPEASEAYCEYRPPRIPEPPTASKSRGVSITVGSRLSSFLQTNTSVSDALLFDTHFLPYHLFGGLPLVSDIDSRPNLCGVKKYLTLGSIYCVFLKASCMLIARFLHHYLATALEGLHVSST